MTKSLTANKTKTPALFAAALLAVLALLAGPSASAREPGRTFRVTFAYNPTDAAETIYAQLRQTANRACHRQLSQFATPGARYKCRMDVMNSVLGVMNRTDLVELHSTKTA